MLTYRGIDTMAWTKDLLDNPVGQSQIDALMSSIKRDFNPTHVGIAVPMNTNAEALAERGSNFAIQPATYAQRFTDSIHNLGMKVLHRGTDCYFEGIYNFPKWVGASRYAAGSARAVLAPTFNDEFERESLGTTDWQTGHQVGNSWTISNGVLVGPAANGWVRTALTKNTFNANCIMVAKVKKVGNQQIVVRATTDSNFPGYGLQMRDTNKLRLERPGLASLGEVDKTWVNGNWYWMKLEATGTTIRGKAWADGDEEPVDWDLSFTDSTYTNGGYCGFSGESSNGQFDSITVTHSPVRSNWLGRVYNYIVNNTALFADGDLWAPFPEATGHGIFNDNTSFLPHSGGIQTNFANFFIDLKTVSEAAFAVIGKNVICGMSAQNWSEINSGWIPSSLHTAYNLLICDHYGTDGEGHTPTQMKADLRAIKNTYNKTVFLQEWGDYWSTDSGRTNPARNQTQHEAYLDSMYTAFQELIDEGTLTGFQYWRATGAHEAVMADADAGAGYDFRMLYEGEKLRTFFRNNSPATTTFRSNRKPRSVIKTRTAINYR